ncbi:MAG: SHOCT domain-containing protein [Thermoplasmata archaeon]
MTFKFTFTVESSEPAGNLLSKLVDYYQKVVVPAKVVDMGDDRALLRRGSRLAMTFREPRKLWNEISILVSEKGSNRSAAVITYEMSLLAPHEGVRKNVESTLESEVEEFKARSAILAPSPSGPEAGTVDLLSELERLGALYSQGLLTEQEFAAAKSKLLD